MISNKWYDIENKSNPLKEEGDKDLDQWLQRNQRLLEN